MNEASHRRKVTRTDEGHLVLKTPTLSDMAPGRDLRFEILLISDELLDRCSTNKIADSCILVLSTGISVDISVIIKKIPK